MRACTVAAIPTSRRREVIWSWTEDMKPSYSAAFSSSASMISR